MMKKYRLLKLLVTILLTVLVIYNFTPIIVHTYFKNKTSSKEIKDNIKLYNDLSISILDGGKDVEQNRIYLDSLYMWFHIRGLQIDEGHDGLTKSEQWSEILHYWE